ncbi:MAG: hypothetical protein ACUVR4_02085 [Anaerolineae bacterium]
MIKKNKANIKWSIIALLTVIICTAGFVPSLADRLRATSQEISLSPAENRKDEAVSTNGQGIQRSFATRSKPVVYLPVIYTPMISYRLGFSANTSPITRFAEISSLKAGWYCDWNVRARPARPNMMEYVQTIRVHQKLTCELYSANAHDRNLCPYATPHDYVFSPSLEEIAAAASANPGSLWLIGNEMDRRDWPGGGQDETLPETYAIAYHDLYYYIKSVDPKARVAIGGVIQATPLRLEYLTKVWNTYQRRYGAPMPVDVWNVHNFILKERIDDHGANIPPGSDAHQGVVYPTDRTHVDMSIFDQQIRAFRAWMKERGQQDKPLIVSEYGVLYWHDGLEDPQVVQDFMIQTFDYFLNTQDCSLGYPADDCRLVERWAWYSLDDKGLTSGFNQYGALFDPITGQITSTGEKFRTYSLTNMPLLAR